MFNDFSTKQDKNSDKVMNRISELESSINKQFESVKKEVETLQTEVNILQEENDELRLQCDSLWQRVVNLEERADDQEARSKRNNLLFFGIKREEQETAQDCERKVKTMLTEKMGMSADIPFDRVHRLGNKTNAPLIARCTFYKDKINILKSSNKLKGTDLYVNEDFPVTVRDKRKKISELVKERREKGEKIKIVYDHVYIENRRYELNECQNGLVEKR